ncbi:hypothetical protein TNCV_4589651 [Trichonephila clavipes]|nr:hypothetical protein TNCV_4589651 [Trichonephila clavipes]
MSVIAHQTEKEYGYQQTRKADKECHKHRLRAQQSNMQSDLRMHICEHIIRFLHQKDVNQKQHICVKHDFVVSNHTITVNLHSGTTQLTLDQGPRNPPWQRATYTPVVSHSFEHHTSDNAIWLDSTPILRENTLEVVGAFHLSSTNLMGGFAAKWLFGVPP